MAEQKLIDRIYQQLDIFQRNAGMYGRRQFFAAAAKLYEIELRLSEIVDSDEPQDIQELVAIFKKVTAIVSNNKKEE